ncbi:MAG: hypothetical protein ABFR75_14740, partial [Acidobacteriota bacterium]
NQYPKSDVIDEYVLSTRNSSTRTVTISTIKQMKKIDLYLYGHSNEGTLDLINFTRPQQEISVRDGVAKSVTLENLRFKKRGSRFFYTLNFKFCYCLEEGIKIKIVPHSHKLN